MAAFGSPATPREPVMSLASSAHEALHLLAELHRGRIGGFALEQSYFLFQFLGFGFDVGQAGLPIFRVDSFVGSKGIGDDGAAEALAQDTLGRLGGTVLIQVKESQVVIAGIPYPILAAVMAPGGFVSMNDH